MRKAILEILDLPDQKVTPEMQVKQALLVQLELKVILVKKVILEILVLKGIQVLQVKKVVLVLKVIPELQGLKVTLEILVQPVRLILQVYWIQQTQPMPSRTHR